MADATTIVDRSSGRAKGGSGRKDSDTWAMVIVASPVPALLGRITTVGKRPSVLGRVEVDGRSDTRMSRNHATAWLASRSPDGVTVRDGAPRDEGGWKNSANGTWVGEAELEGEDEVLVEHGKTVLTGTTLWMAVRNPDPGLEDTLLVGVSNALGTARDELSLVVAQTAMRLKRRGQVTQALLVTGPRGTGKQVVAREAHRLLSERMRKEVPFRQVSAPSLADGTVAADLFGVVDRYATNVKGRPGYFQQADGGVLLLDEVGDTPTAEQAKLLNVLQERQVTPLGGQKAIPFNTLVVSATNKDLAGMAATHEFREDLLDRLGRFRVHLPPLDERPEDIPFIAAALAKRHGYKQPLSWDVVEALLDVRWQGNVRELDMAIERAVALAQIRADGELSDELIQQAFDGIQRPREDARRSTGKTATAASGSEPTGRQRPSREDLLAQLEAASWNKAQVARHYGKHPRQITRWMAYLDIERPE